MIKKLLILILTIFISSSVYSVVCDDSEVSANVGENIYASNECRINMSGIGMGDSLFIYARTSPVDVNFIGDAGFFGFNLYVYEEHPFFQYQDGGGLL